ncbi:MAG: nucleoside triphosphate pyrophosphohydrolase, partial [Cellvibrionaceae bacterium]|nr:nucleoside triphosphate pyrophosphohydrolase [Cellvibrionaceae bacterium]
AIADELGDNLFCLVNLCRHLKLDAETVLRHANQKFEKRFEQVEAQVAASGKPWEQHQLAQLEAYWQGAKQRSKSP